MLFVKKHINKEVIITGNPYNTQKWQYPMEAIREIITNMIVHRDYRSASDSIVKIFKDKIEFYNPGRLPENISIKNLINGNYKSTPRNKQLAKVFKDMGLMEKYGSGIGRIVNYFKQEGSPVPEFKNISDGFQVTVFTKDDAVVNPESEGINLLFELIEQNPHKRIPFFAEYLKLPVKTIERQIKKLKENKKIIFVGSNKTGGYIVNTNR
jgi:ATP-dependent DNA helicase RecG